MFLRRILFSAVLLCAAFANAPQAAAREMEDMSVVVVRSIDKLSARTHTFDIPVDKTVQFGKSLFIKVRACRKSPPVGEPEAAAFLQIWERKPHEDQSKWVFSGWMYSSNPALSAMDHPVYDVWVIDCKKSATSAKSEEFSSEVAPDEAAADAAAVSGEAEGVDTEASPDDTEASPADE
ncbi:MAG TPA: DUF2155 domain-containing protein [Alphaproteobacteria bacterium]|nr:DUF2155 domain-containing protein [Alphaproteobacteria bacterium]